MRLPMPRKLMSAALIIFAVLSFTCPRCHGADDPSAKHPKYVFLMIGDGMGVSQRSLADRFVKELGGPTGKTGLVMESLPNSAITDTASLSGVTDSAAAGTAIACGVKTKNGFLGMTPDGKNVDSLAVFAKQRGMKVGIVTSDHINGATPSAFYAHVNRRGAYSDINPFIPKSGFDLFAGDEFLLTGGSGERPDAQLARQGYKVIRGFDKFKAAKKLERLVCVQQFDFAIDAKDKAPSLSETLSKTIDLLDGDQGFFIMLEGARIDWACHNNDIAAAIKEVVDFDNAVKVALDFLKNRPDRTLLVVTADHETGGLEISDSKGSLAPIQSRKCSMAAFQNHVDELKKKASFDDLAKSVNEKFGLTDLSADELAKLKDAYYGGKNQVIAVCAGIFDARCGVKWKTSGHTGAKVKTTAAGAGSELFNGEMDNTDIPKRLKQLMAR
jgi:alkaline phosphatase